MKFLFLFLSFFSLAYAEISVETLSTSPRIYFLPDFLSEVECDHLIELARPHLQPSTVIDDHSASHGLLDSRRTSQGMFFSPELKDKTLRKVERRLATLTKLPVENGEAIQVLQYKKGAEYQPHYDYFNPSTTGGSGHLSRGGQRVATVIMYLNTPEKGGETIFPAAKVTVTPKKGSAVLFYNCSPTGEVDPLSLHGGAPVLLGEKWIATKWIRQGVFK
jgi:prolyl 4-hydroxylase